MATRRRSRKQRSRSYESPADEQYRKGSTYCAAMMLTQKGATLHPHETGWDVELADGSWRPANSWQELCQIAGEVCNG